MTSTRPLQRNRRMPRVCGSARRRCHGENPSGATTSMAVVAVSCRAAIMPRESTAAPASVPSTGGPCWRNGGNNATVVVVFLHLPMPVVSTLPRPKPASGTEAIRHCHRHRNSTDRQRRRPIRTIPIRIPKTTTSIILKGVAVRLSIPTTKWKTETPVFDRAGHHRPIDEPQWVRVPGAKLLCWGKVSFRAAVVKVRNQITSVLRVLCLPISLRKLSSTTTMKHAPTFYSLTHFLTIQNVTAIQISVNPNL